MYAFKIKVDRTSLAIPELDREIKIEDMDCCIRNTRRRRRSWRRGAP